VDIDVYLRLTRHSPCEVVPPTTYVVKRRPGRELRAAQHRRPESPVPWPRWRRARTVARYAGGSAGDNGTGRVGCCSPWPTARPTSPGAAPTPRTPTSSPLSTNALGSALSPSAAGAGPRPGRLNARRSHLPQRDSFDASQDVDARQNRCPVTLQAAEFGGGYRYHDEGVRTFVVTALASSTGGRNLHRPCLPIARLTGENSPAVAIT